MRILVIAPHPDDETLGAGGYIKKQKKMGNEIFWLNMTNVTEDSKWGKEFVQLRKSQIKKVCEFYEFDGFFDLGYEPCSLENIDKGEIISKVGDIITQIKPNCVILPNPGDAHSDHKITYDVGMACSKTFRYPSVKKILVMEILSETDFSKTGEAFSPNYFVDISAEIQAKETAMKIYDTEISDPPFPRSLDAIRALALLRGGMAGCYYAEAFKVIKEIE